MCKTKSGLKSLKNNELNNIKIGSLNIRRSFFSKQLELQCLAETHDLSILNLQEVDPDYPPALKGYQVIFPEQVNTNKKARTLTFIRHDIYKYCEQENLKQDDNVQACWMKLKFPNRRPILLTNLYHEWFSNSTIQQNEQVDRFLDLFCTNLKESGGLIVGDFNIDSLLWDKSSYHLKTLSNKIRDTLAMKGLVHHDLQEHTFEQNREGKVITSALDHVFHSPDINNLYSKCSTVSFSDHKLITFSIHTPIETKKAHKKITYRTKIKDISLFKYELSCQDWGRLLETDDPSDQVRMFYEFFNEIYDRHSSKKTRYVKQNNAIPNVSKHTKNLIRCKEKAWQTYRKSSLQNKQSNYEQYKQARNKVTNAIKEEEKEQLAKLTVKFGANNPWKAVNFALGQKKTNSNDITIRENGSLLNEPATVSEKLNDYFVDKITNIKKSIISNNHVDPLCKLREKYAQSSLKFTLKPICESLMVKTLKKLKNSSPGFDEIPMALLKLCSDVICVPLTRIINSSILSGKFPEQFKVAKIIPIPKKSNGKNDVSNYRPISILPALSKLFEAVVEKQIRSYIESNNLLPDYQFGFRSHRSTNCSNQSLINYLQKAKNSGKVAGVCAIDMTAAFDNIEPKLLCSKLELIGFDDIAVKWIYSYLTNRKQAVEINGHKSTLKNLE